MPNPSNLQISTPPNYKIPQIILNLLFWCVLRTTIEISEDVFVEKKTKKQAELRISPQIADDVIIFKLCCQKIYNWEI